MADKKKFNLDEWWNDPKTKRFTGILYNVGASVVIIGAMFKILHLPGASLVLGAGMITEAFLFFIGVFDTPMPEYHWDRYFPNLIGHSGESSPINTNGGIGGGVSQVASVGGGASVGANVNVPSLKQEEVDNLKNGIVKLSETAAQLASLSAVANASEKLNKNLEAAADAASDFVASQTNLSQSYATIADGMNKVAGQTTSYAANVETANNTLASINSVYELQLKNVQAQAELFSQQGQKLSAAGQSLDQVVAEVAKLQQATVSAAAEGEKYKAGINQLSQQIADLNKVYGNMLNALN